MQEKKTQPRRSGSIKKKRDGVFLVSVFLERDANGKRQYHYKQIKGTKADAQTYLNDILHSKDTGTFVQPVALTLNEYLTKWLATAARPRVSERTHEGYQYLLNQHVQPELGKQKLSDVRPLHIQKLYSDMQERGLSARTVRYLHAVLSSALKQAVRWGMLARNPAELVELPRQARKEMLALSPKEATEFLKAAVPDRWGVLFAFALATGMRPEEYLGLQWKDADLEHGVVTVRRALVWRSTGGGWYFSEPKTARSRRQIPLPASTLLALKEHRRQQAEERLKAGAAYQQIDLVFATPEGGPLAPRNLKRRHFRPILKRAKLPLDFRLYDLRHSCATLLLAAGEHPKVVSERLGHASVTLTLDVYSHVLPTMQEAASKKLESLLYGKKKGTA
ncbi:MAG TPA: tyrosine-type recombinase/integrase [Pyrinomonadaceae bacterium]|nr:tyrosine-type recombinase/integrase [Pyrinomonadaceae bacterium]